MSERLTTARSGAATAYFGAIALHSAYDPVAEADRYAASLELSSKCHKLILVEPCLGYLTSSIRRRFPTTSIIAVHCSAFFSPPVLYEQADAEWTPAESKDCATFLEEQVEDWEAAATQVIEWRPAVAAYGAAARDTFQAITNFLRRAAANERTVRAFGRRWFRNAIRNAGNIQSSIAIKSGDAPVLVAGAGPGLEEQAFEIARAKKAFPCSVIAVSSAVPALLSHGIRADLVVASDGGAWAAFHLYEAARARLPVAASLVAQLPTAFAAIPTLAVTDGSAWQRVLISTSGQPFFAAPQRGTVTATAIDLALAITVGKIYVAGMDLATRDIRTHARPYALDRFREDASCRLSPEYGAAFERSLSIRSSSSLDVYASWFADRADRYSERLVMLGAPNPSLASLRYSDHIDSGGGRNVIAKVVPAENRGEPRIRYSTAATALLHALDAEGGSGPLTHELTSLLLGAATEERGAASRRSATREAVLEAAKGLAIEE